jgi:hypothetical protein
MGYIFHIFLLSVILSIAAVEGRLFEGSLSGDSFAFLGKFVFDYNPEQNSTVGIIQMNIDYGDATSAPPENSDLFVYTYYDDAWSKVYKNSSATCEDLKSMASPPVDASGKPIGPPGLPITVNLNVDSPYCPSPKSLCYSHLQKITQHKRARYWYLVIFHRDDCKKPVNIPHFRIEFQNKLKDGSFTQLSFDEYGVLPTYILSLAVWGLGFVIHAIAHIRESDLSSQSPIVRLFHLSFLLAIASLGTYTMHWIKYANNGIGYPVALKIAELVSVGKA